MAQENQSHQTEKVYRILKALHTALALLALALAAALTVMVLLFLDLRGENDQLAKVKASNENLKAENKNLIHKVPEAWVVHNGILYYFSCKDKSWEEAERFCVSLGSHLTSVTSMGEQEFIVKKADGSNYWIGLNKQWNSEWRWTDGTPYNGTNSKEFWAQNEPNNKMDKEHCVHFSKNRLQSWNDNDCLLPMLFICKWDCKSSGLCP
ncbi:C-type lectin domain family 4 member K-like isoform X1 [Sarcophilus harrisii]|uniref:C-type lectin domain-containing protein n=1 Tax=Sarcophilus harrisii TaxID=9305 RepID=A0A7N4NTF7_SARHA|nr:C-type lectin domain family 4 member K-like isoform X1 [Sarcophilus harrisii]